ncbi:alpha/beta hydrolase [Mycobacterium sp. M26]|uniref:alpha/beta fold hydrolase n=1 Tax=Mycobacterium sp. M26 TaxID=1762962 RepID=UPI0009E66B69|nr:alpha/beta hydrolase [Mycobacterium sp. M26]
MSLPGVQTFAVQSDGGLDIACDRRGAAHAPAVVFLHGAGQTRRSWAKAAAAVAARGWQAVTVDLRGHGDSDWAEDGDYRVVSFAGDVLAVLRTLPDSPVVIGASLGGFTAMLLAGEIATGVARAVVLVDIVPEMDESGARRIFDFMADNMSDGFASLDEVADVLAGFNPHRARPTDLAGLATNLRRRGDRWYWHWDPRFITGMTTQGPVEIGDHERLYTAIGRILQDQTPMLLVRGQMSDLVSQANADRLLARYPQIEFTDVRGAGHMVVGDRNDIFASAVIEFLDRHSAEKAAADVSETASELQEPQSG